MSHFKKLKRYAKDPWWALSWDLIQKHPKLMTNKWFLSTKFRYVFGRPINWKNPTTFSEKLQWLKVYDRNPLYTTLVDKYRVKEYVTKLIGEEFVFPLYKVYEKADDINFDELPNQFVLKCNNDSGSLIICRDKLNGEMFLGKSDDKVHLSIEEARNILDSGLKRNFYNEHHEWAYKDVKPCIIAEKYMECKTSERKDLFDYKFWCFNGEPKYIWLGTNYTPSYFDIYSTDWVNQHIEYGYSNAPQDAERPPKLDEMLDIARKLSKGIPHVRVDLYEIDGRIYFGEYTFYTWAGLEPFIPNSFDKVMGDCLDLPTKKS